MEKKNSKPYTHWPYNFYISHECCCPSESFDPVKIMLKHRFGPCVIVNNLLLWLIRFSSVLKCFLGADLLKA